MALFDRFSLFPERGPERCIINWRRTGESQHEGFMHVIKATTYTVDLTSSQSASPSWLTTAMSDK